MGNAWKHFKTITYHKVLVAKGCFRIGLFWQGLCHDMSKYSPSEFMIGVKYFQGTRSPNNAEREENGCSTAWLHHKGRNKHHYEYWVDYSDQEGQQGRLVPVPMPNRYIAEMVMDRIAASKIYQGKNYTDASPLEYYMQGNHEFLIHPETDQKLENILQMLSSEGEDKTFAYIKKELLGK